jgi:hypothetical protein
MWLPYKWHFYHQFKLMFLIATNSQAKTSEWKTGSAIIFTRGKDRHLYCVHGLIGVDIWQRANNSYLHFILLQEGLLYPWGEGKVVVSLLWLSLQPDKSTLAVLDWLALLPCLSLMNTSVRLNGDTICIASLYPLGLVGLGPGVLLPLPVLGTCLNEVQSA